MKRPALLRLTDAASTAASDPADPTVAWCPPIPDAADDPTEEEIASAADQLDILISQPKAEVNPFCNPANLGVLPHLWLQARLQFTLPAIQEKFSRILVSVAGELWLRGEGATIEAVLPRVARALTVRLAEKLAQALSTLMRLAESMVTPETECLLYATYCFRAILSELLHTAGESAALNKNRAPSGPVKVLVTDREPKRVQNVVDVCSGASSLLAWFPASWASKIAPEFLANPTENGQTPQIQELACPKRAGVDDSEKQHKLQAVRFSARDLPFFDLAIDREIRDGDFFAKLIQGYSENLVEPNMMRGLQPVIPCRTTLEVIIPSRDLEALRLVLRPSLLRQLRLKILARQHRHRLLQVQPYWDFNNSIIQFRVPMSLALSCAVCFVFFFCFGCVWFACLHPRLDPLDCVMVHALFRRKEGCCCTMHNSSNGTNTVLRPGKSREGEGRKKTRFVLVLIRFCVRGVASPRPRLASPRPRPGRRALKRLDCRLAST